MSLSLARRVQELMQTHELDRDQAIALAELEVAHGAVKARAAHVARAEATAAAMDEAVPVATIARVLGVTRSTVYAWEREG